MNDKPFLITIRAWTLAFAGALILWLLGAATARADDAPPPAYTADGRLLPPKDYREWIYLSSGLDMSYRPRTDMPGHSMFDNVFAEPGAYRAFKATGHWPDRTVLVMEVRGAQSRGSINQTGQFQAGAVMGVEVHVRDAARFGSSGGWGFFAFDGDTPATQIPVAASCYACHQQNGVVDTTFVQFYPTLLEVAKDKGTLKADVGSDALAPITAK